MATEVGYDSYSTYPSASPRVKELKQPSLQNDDDVAQFVSERIYYTHPIRLDDFSRWRKAELYDDNFQWLRKAFSYQGAAGPSQWIVEPRTRYSIPHPVYNEGVGMRENETARLGRPEYKPRVRVVGPDADIRAREGARAGERALRSREREMQAEKVYDAAYYQMPLFGGAWLLSYLDLSWLKTVKVPRQGVMACPRRQGATVGEGQAPPDHMTVEADDGAWEQYQSEHPEMMGEGGEGGVGGVPRPRLMIPMPESCDYTNSLSYAAPGHPAPGTDTCPSCPDHPPLVPLQPTLEEAGSKTDSHGNPLGEDKPMGDWCLRALSPYDVFLPNAGVDVAGYGEFIYCHVETLDWVAERWPEHMRDKAGELKIKAENPGVLMREHPIAGSPAVYGSGREGGLFRNSVRVKEYHREPWLEWDERKKCYVKNKGRSVVVVGEKAVVCNTNFLIPSMTSPGKFFERCRLRFVPFAPRSGGRRAGVGTSLWDRMFDIQDGINERESQIRAVNERGAVPLYLEDRLSNLEFRAADEAIPFRRIAADIDPNKKTEPLTLINNTTIAEGVYHERDANFQSLQRIANRVEVERGQVPPGVAAATAIAYLKTEAGEIRRPRIKRLKEAMADEWGHGLEVIQAIYIEERPYRYQEEDSDEEIEAFISGARLTGNYTVDVAPVPDFDIQDQQRENVRDLIQLGVLDVRNDSQVKRKVIKAIDNNLEFFLDDNNQEKQAQKEWHDFIERGRVPVVDPSLDDPKAHYQEHGRSCFLEKFRDLEDKANWDGALEILGPTWDDALGRLIAPPPPPMQIAPPGLPPGLPLPGGPPMGAAPMGAPMGMPMGAPMGAPMGGLPMLPQPPPPPPRSLQNQILDLWTSTLTEQGFQPPDPNALKGVLSWRAHMEAHRLYAEQKQVKAQAGVPTAAAPGADQTKGGMEPAAAGPAAGSDMPTGALSGGGGVPGQTTGPDGVPLPPELMAAMAASQAQRPPG